MASIILGSVSNSASLSLDSFLGSVQRDRQATEARLSLGGTYGEAIAPMVHDTIRRRLLPIINQMSAAGIVSLPGILTGHILEASTARSRQIRDPADVPTVRRHWILGIGRLLSRGAAPDGSASAVRLDRLR
ncbi:MAG TPA: ABC transporter permease [Bradyrhizobium sp.]|nr:ABC transporter permease [Bradyrhizobium sp.]